MTGFQSFLDEKDLRNYQELLIIHLDASGACRMTTHIDWFVHADFAVANLDVEAAARVSAHPCFVVHGRPLAAEIGQWNQVTGTAFLTLGERYIHPPNPPNQLVPMRGHGAGQPWPNSVYNNPNISTIE